MHILRILEHALLEGRKAQYKYRIIVIISIRKEIFNYLHLQSLIYLLFCILIITFNIFKKTWGKSKCSLNKKNGCKSKTNQIKPK